MKKIIFAGDSTLHGAGGYCDTLESILLTQNPTTPFFFEKVKSDCETLESLLQSGVPHIIGRAPSKILISTGSRDIQSSMALDALAEKYREILTVLGDKTGASVVITNLAPDFYLGNSFFYDRSTKFNQMLEGLTSGGLASLVDIHHPLENYLEHQRNSPGEIRALHKEGPELLPAGTYLIASIVAPFLAQELVT